MPALFSHRVANHMARGVPAYPLVVMRACHHTPNRVAAAAPLPLTRAILDHVAGGGQITWYRRLLPYG